MRSVVPSARFVSTNTVQLAVVIGHPSLSSEIAGTDGDGHPQLGSTPSQAWLQTHWGTTRALRQVRLQAHQQRRSAQLGIKFWAADWTPWPVFALLRDHYPALKFAVRPVYGDD